MGLAETEIGKSFNVSTPSSNPSVLPDKPPVLGVGGITSVNIIEVEILSARDGIGGVDLESILSHIGVQEYLGYLSKKDAYRLRREANRLLSEMLEDD